MHVKMGEVRCACKKVLQTGYRKERGEQFSWTRKREAGILPTLESQRESKHIVRPHNILSGLVPLCHQANQRTDGTSQTDNTIIDIDVSESRDRNEKIAKV
jgi:hypothetical protein